MRPFSFAFRPFCSANPAVRMRHMQKYLSTYDNKVSDAFLGNVEKPKQKNYAQRRAYSKKIYDALKNF